MTTTTRRIQRSKMFRKASIGLGMLLMAAGVSTSTANAGEVVIYLSGGGTVSCSSSHDMVLPHGVSRDRVERHRHNDHRGHDHGSRISITRHRNNDGHHHASHDRIDDRYDGYAVARYKYQPQHYSDSQLCGTDYERGCRQTYRSSRRDDNHCNDHYDAHRHDRRNVSLGEYRQTYMTLPSRRGQRDFQTVHRRANNQRSHYQFHYGNSYRAGYRSSIRRCR